MNEIIEIDMTGGVTMEKVDNILRILGVPKKDVEPNTQLKWTTLNDLATYAQDGDDRTRVFEILAEAGYCFECESFTETADRNEGFMCKECGVEK